MLRMRRNIFVLAVLLASTSQGLPQHKHSSWSDEEYADDYGYGDYSSDVDDGEYLNENEKVVHTVPEFVTDPIVDTVNEGDTFKLPCFVEKLDGFTLMWKKGKKILSLGDNLMNKDPRYNLVKGQNGNTLVITLAESTDAGEYECELSSNSKPSTIRHNIAVRVEPVIQTKPARGVLVVHEGESATLQCNVLRGSPMPRISWKRKERKMPNGAESYQGDRITFQRVNRHHSGVYFCEADNGFGREPVRVSLKLDVQHAPIVEQEQTFIHTSENDETEVVCIVHASPKAEVVWLKNGRPLLSDQGIVSQRKNRHTLLLPGIKESTFGVYTCRATNKFGSDERTTEVSGLASPVNFKSSPDGLNSDSFFLEWVTESRTPVTAFRTRIRPLNSNRQWTEFLVENAVSNGENFYSGGHTFAGLEEGALYEVRVASENDYGFSDYSESFAFGTRGADVVIPLKEDEEDSTNEIIGPIQEPSTGNGATRSIPASAISTSVWVLALGFFFLRKHFN